MNEMEELFEICNKGHKRMSGAAKFWVLVAILFTGIPLLVVLCILVFEAYWK